MADKAKKVSALKAAFGTIEVSRDGEDVSVKCPKCAKHGSSKKKLVINLDKGMYHCWVCGIKGRNIKNSFFLLGLNKNFSIKYSL